MKAVLLAAGVYNLAWGGVAIVAPNLFFELARMDVPRYPQLWQCIGMIVGVYGIGYAIAAFDPFRHWPIVLVGLLGKVLGPIGFLQAVMQGELPWAFGANILTNDLIWWVPFALILRGAWLASRRRGGGDDPAGHGRPRLEDALATQRANDGRTLAELSMASPVLVVFLRHLGCTFCREAAADIARQRSAIEADGVRIVLVHPTTDEAAAPFLDRYGLADLPRIASPDGSLYRAFDLARGSIAQLFGPRLWWRGFVAGVLHGHWVGRMQGDGFQMPGVFLLRDGRVARAFRHGTAADRPDYHELCRA